MNSDKKTYKPKQANVEKLKQFLLRKEADKKVVKNELRYINR